jgi:hypothetical protein
MAFEISHLSIFGKALQENTSHLLYDSIPESHLLTPSVILARSTQKGAQHE